MSAITKEQAEEHLAFLQKIVNDYRDTILKHVEPRAALAIDHELQSYGYAVAERERFRNENPEHFPDE